MRKEYSLNLNYSTSLGTTYSAFMEGLKNRIFVANRCTTCRRLYAPPRPFCDICCEPTDTPSEIEPEGRVISYTVYPAIPAFAHPRSHISSLRQA